MSTENNHKAQPRWAALINDRTVTTPSREVAVSTLKVLGAVPPEHVLFRDHNSPEDEILADEAKVDLTVGNVFYSRECPQERPHPRGCEAPAKLAFFVDDRFEQAVAELTVSALLQIFGLPAETKFLRDYESPNDQPLNPHDTVRFAEGPVFYTRGCEVPAPSPVNIIVNGREETVTEPQISYTQLVILAFKKVDPSTIYTILYKRGPKENPEGKMVEGDVVFVKCGMVFNVTPTRKS